jgi:hypothetical protein
MYGPHNDEQNEQSEQCSRAATILAGGRRGGSASASAPRTRTKRTHPFKGCSHVRLSPRGRLEVRGSGNIAGNRVRALANAEARSPDWSSTTVCWRSRKDIAPASFETGHGEQMAQRRDARHIAMAAERNRKAPPHIRSAIALADGIASQVALARRRTLFDLRHTVSTARGTALNNS